MKIVSVYKVFPFLVYFDIIQCSVLLVLTLIILLLSVFHFQKNRPPKLSLSRPSSFEYYVLKGENSVPVDSAYGTGTASGKQSTAPSSFISGTDPYWTGTGTGRETAAETENNDPTSFLTM